MMNGPKIEIDREECVGCKLCFEACLKDVYRWDEAEGKPITAYPEDCVMCLQCEETCTAQCIDVTPPMVADTSKPF